MGWKSGNKPIDKCMDIQFSFKTWLEAMPVSNNQPGVPNAPNALNKPTGGLKNIQTAVGRAVQGNQNVKQAVRSAVSQQLTQGGVNSDEIADIADMVDKMNRNPQGQANAR